MSTNCNICDKSGNNVKICGEYFCDKCLGLNYTHGVYHPTTGPRLRNGQNMMIKYDIEKYLRKKSTVYEQIKQYQRANENILFGIWGINYLSELPKKILDKLKNTNVEIEFTICKEEILEHPKNIQTISIVHPCDFFERSVGCETSRAKMLKAIGKVFANKEDDILKDEGIFI